MKSLELEASLSC